MPETVPRWLLVGAGVVALVIILVEVKDFAERKSAVSPSPASRATVVPSDAKSAAKTTSKTRRARASTTAVLDSAVERVAADTLEKLPAAGGIVQASVRAPLETDDGGMTRQPEPVAIQIKAGPARCLPLPNSTKPGDVDALYYQNWAREYGCGFD